MSNALFKKIGDKLDKLECTQMIKILLGPKQVTNCKIKQRRIRRALLSFEVYSDLQQF